MNNNNEGIDNVMLRSFVVERGNKYYYIFDDMSETGRVLRSGLHHPLCSFDPSENLLFWADVSPVIGTTNLRKVKTIRENLINIDKTKYAIASKDISVLTTKNFNALLQAIGVELNLTLVKNASHDLPYVHVHVIENILQDSR